MNDDQDPDQPQPAPRPQAYPFETALEAALAPEPEHSAERLEPGLDLPRLQHNTDDWFTQPIPGDSSRDTATGAGTATATGAATDTAAGNGGGAAATAAAAGSGEAGAETATALGHGGPYEDADTSRAGARSSVSSLAPPADDLIQQSFEDAIQHLRPWQRVFIRALRQYGGVVRLACERARISRRTAGRYRLDDEAFRQAWQDACEDATDLVEAATYRSAVHGDLEPVFQRGVCVGYRRRFCVKSRELLLKARRPQEYDRGETLHVKGETRVTIVPAAKLAATVTSVTDRLFRARQQQLGMRQPLLDADTGKPATD